MQQVLTIKLKILPDELLTYPPHHTLKNNSACKSAVAHHLQRWESSPTKINRHI